MTATAGRSCPLHYRYQPAQLCRDPEPDAGDLLYIAGGLYGNPFALDSLEALMAAEARQGSRGRLLFNGDFNWFNASDRLFREINERVRHHSASLGNVEYELASPSEGVGCGCGYPESVDEAVVARSNRIMARLQRVAANHADIQHELSRLPRWRCLMFGGLKVLLLHGDPQSLAGWGLGREAMVDGGGEQLEAWFRDTGADIMVCSHTCLPLLWQREVDGRLRTLVNNGSAGMGNLHRDYRGLSCRIARRPPAGTPVSGIRHGLVWVSLQPVDFDLRAWLGVFDNLWPGGSDAARSYRSRILEGTSLPLSAVRV